MQKSAQARKRAGGGKKERKASVDQTGVNPFAYHEPAHSTNREFKR